ncbi:hydrophobic W protein [Clostridium acidisoli DSM 12555]|uniref:Hydrophobic W protein n=1 Tax=Clostridium acidisoli DSM 12555 TaxID=1121291 RepID=A0A1W1XZV8_9CLOT|nr:hypothetical protein [Clostridium acidisoli]SMC29422.1 hydrophobic W protein [Clostridium acidisoli DSM 12555]
MNGQTAKADTKTVGVTYEFHVQNIGWQSWVSDGAEAATDGQGLRVEAIEVKIVNTTNTTSTGLPNTTTTSNTTGGTSNTSSVLT